MICWFCEYFKKIRISLNDVIRLNSDVIRFDFFPKDF